MFQINYIKKKSMIMKSQLIRNIKDEDDPNLTKLLQKKNKTIKKQ